MERDKKLVERYNIGWVTGLKVTLSLNGGTDKKRSSIPFWLIFLQ